MIHAWVHKQKREKNNKIQIIKEDSWETKEITNIVDVIRSILKS